MFFLIFSYLCKFEVCGDYSDNDLNFVKSHFTKNQTAVFPAYTVFLLSNAVVV